MYFQSKVEQEEWEDTLEEYTADEELWAFAS